MFVYFIAAYREKRLELIKIGMSRNPEKRGLLAHEPQS